MSLTQNENGHETCGYCIDGWVGLKGTETFNGVEYSRGNAPCQWCETGLRRYQHAVEPPKGGRHWVPDMAYTIDDVDIPGGDGPRFKPTPEWLAERGVRPGTPLIEALPPVDDDVEQKRKLADTALNRLHDSETAPPEAASDHAEPSPVLQAAGFQADDELPY